MKRWFALLAVCASTLPQPSSAAQFPPNTSAGMWIWDQPHLAAPPTMRLFLHMTAQHWLIMQDDGVRYSAYRIETFDRGQTLTEIEDVAEDGAAHRIGPAQSSTLRVSRLPSGGLRIVSDNDHDILDRTCHVSADHQVMTCNGTHIDADGASSEYTSPFRHDPRIIVVPPDAPAAAGQGR